MAMRRTATLPQEMMMDIIYRLPAKSIGKFRCVSNYWRNRLSNPRFIKAHLSIQSRKAHEKFIHDHDGSLYTITFNADDVVISTKLNFQLQDKGFIMAGSCSGLVLAVCEEMDVYLINPTTSKFQVIPDCPLPLPGRDPSTVVSLGYDAVSDDYKVVAVSYCYDGSDDENEYDDVNKTFVDVYSAKNALWRRLENVPNNFFPVSNAGVFVNGALHWLANRFKSSIVAFDISAEKFSEVLPPNTDNLKCHYYFLSALSGCLCLCASAMTRTDNMVLFWMMKEYGVKESWTLFKISEPSLLGSLCVPLYSRNDEDDDIVLIRYGKLVSYNVKEKNYRFLIGHEPPVYGAHTFMDSLVCLPFGDGIGV